MGRAEEAFLLDRLVKLRDNIDQQLARLAEMRERNRIRPSTVSLIEDKISALRHSRQELERLAQRLKERLGVY